MSIHSTAIVHPKAELDEDVIIGPYCIVGEHVKIGRGTELLSHVCVGMDGYRTAVQVFPLCVHWDTAPTSSIS